MPRNLVPTLPSLAQNLPCSFLPDPSPIRQLPVCNAPAALNFALQRFPLFVSLAELEASISGNFPDPRNPQTSYEARREEVSYQSLPESCLAVAF